ncbi:hypothetical protein QTP86_024134 [Hemibagrus guttatus]|nr:hypothetical protein QTP86_024134 [Hemibagrus guttatus]
MMRMMMIMKKKKKKKEEKQTRLKCVIGHQLLNGVPTHHRAHTRAITHTMGNLETPISLEAYLWTVGGNSPSTGRTCKLHTHSEQEQDSNPGYWRCEVNVLTAKPPCCQQETMLKVYFV